MWRTRSDEKHCVSPVESPVYCIACSPSSSDEAAIAYHIYLLSSFLILDDVFLIILIFKKQVRKRNGDYVKYCHWDGAPQAGGARGRGARAIVVS